MTDVADDHQPLTAAVNSASYWEPLYVFNPWTDGPAAVTEVCSAPGESRRFRNTSAKNP